MTTVQAGGHTQWGPRENTEVTHHGGRAWNEEAGAGGLRLRARVLGRKGTREIRPQRGAQKEALAWGGLSLSSRGGGPWVPDPPLELGYGTGGNDREALLRRGPEKTPVPSHPDEPAQNLPKCEDHACRPESVCLGWEAGKGPYPSRRYGVAQ